MKPLNQNQFANEPFLTLHSLLDSIKLLKRAPDTEKTNFPKEGSPYKPLFLALIIVGVFRKDSRFNTGTIYYEECLPLLKHLYSELKIDFDYSDKNHPAIVQPFWYLGSGSPKLLELIPNMQKQRKLQELLDESVQIKKESKLLSVSKCARIDHMVFPFLLDPIWNQVILDYLLVEHFPSNKGTLTVSNIKDSCLSLFKN